MSPKKRYKGFVKGDELDGAVILDNLRDWHLAWTKDLNKSRIVIAQRIDLDNDDQEAEKIKWMLRVIQRFFTTQTDDVPSLLVIDEGMDFFGPTGNAFFSNIIQRCWRAGGEKGMSCMIGVQRPKTINLQMLTESDLLYLFHLAFDTDLKRLNEMGWPKGVSSPGEETKKRFIFMKDGRIYPKMLTLKLT